MPRRADDRQETALIKEFVQPWLPGGRDEDTPISTPEPETLRLHQLFDQDTWTPVEAMWLFSCGKLAPAAKTSAYKKVERALRRPQDWIDLPGEISDATLNLACEARNRLPTKKWPTFRHHWIRFAVQFHLPVTLAFWTAYGDWKAARWAYGYEMAYLCELSKTATQTDEYQVLFGPVPAETVWTLPIGLEEAGIDDQPRGRLHFRFSRTGRPFEELVRAVKDSRDTITSRRDPNAIELSTIKRVGVEDLERIAAAVERLAQQNDIGRESGLFCFPQLYPKLISQLREIDPLLVEVSDDKLRHALPRYVKGKRGAPRKSGSAL